MGAPTLDQVAVGGIVWAYARGWWREARVVAVGSAPGGVVVRGVVRVAFRLGVHSAWRLREQALPLSKIRLERPQAFRVIANVPAPELSR